MPLHPKAFIDVTSCCNGIKQDIRPSNVGQVYGLCVDSGSKQTAYQMCTKMYDLRPAQAWKAVDLTSKLDKAHCRRAHNFHQSTSLHSFLWTGCPEQARLYKDLAGSWVTYLRENCWKMKNLRHPNISDNFKKPFPWLFQVTRKRAVASELSAKGVREVSDGASHSTSFTVALLTAIVSIPGHRYNPCHRAGNVLQHCVGLQPKGDESEWVYPRYKSESCKSWHNFCSQEGLVPGTNFCIERGVTLVRL